MGGSGRRRVVEAVLLLFLLVGAASALERVDVALAGAHLPGAVPGGIGDIASVARITDGQTSVDIARGWADYDDAALESGPAEASTLRWVYLALDVVLMASLARLLFIARRALTDWLAAGTAPAESAYRTIVQRSKAALILYLVADLAETSLATVVVPVSWFDAWPRAIGILSLVKWVALGLAILALAIGARREEPVAGLAANAVPRLMALRGQIVVALLLVVLLVGLSGDLGRQIDDVLVVAADNVLPAGIATFLMAVTCVALYVGGIACLAAYRASAAVPPVSVPAYKRVWWTVLLLVVLGGILFAVGWKATAWSLWIVAIGLGVWALLSSPALVRGYTRPSSGPLPVGAGSRRTAAALSALPAVALYVAAVRAATSQATSGSTPTAMLVWVLVCLVVGLLVTAGAQLHADSPWARTLSDRVDPFATRLPLSVLGVCGGVGLVVAVTAATEPWAWIGTPAVVILFAALLACSVAALVVLSDATPPRGALAMTGLRRMPFVTMLVLWGLLASLADTEGRYYDARTTSAAKEVAGGGDGGVPVARAARDRLEAPEAAIDRWLGRLPQPTTPTPGTPEPPRTTTSLVFVAAAGGGIRSAYWTARTWDCAIGPACGDGADHTSDVFFASGVSGGAVGLVQVRAHQLPPAANDGSAPGSSDAEDGDWVDRAMSADHLAPSVAAFLFRDLPNSALRLQPKGKDRAATLELAFEAEEPRLKADLLAQQQTFPILSFSAVSVEDGCRLAISTVRQSTASGTTNCHGADIDLPDDLGPGEAPVRDGVDYLCAREDRESMTLSTAAFLSARFPFVAPNGGLRQCGDEGQVTYALDGGVFDNSGGAAVTRMWTAVAPKVRDHNTKAGSCVIPRLLVIDSHYATGAAPSPSGRPLQSVGPAVALGNVYAERSSRALAEATRTIRDAADGLARGCGVTIDPESVVQQVYPEGSSGPQGPLGWTLSESSRRDLTTQVFDVCRTPSERAKQRNNCTAVPRVRSWFSPPAPS